MGIREQYPDIKPSLNLDFANTKQLDPRITFTRTTTARYYDGKTVAKAEENLLLRSQDYSATWTVTNLTSVTGKTAPDGTSTATEFTAGAANAVLTQGFTAIAGSYTFSVWLRRVTGTGDIQIAADNGTWTTKVITGTWARYDVTQTVAAGSKTAGIRVVTSGDAIEVWGAQLEQRSAVTAYTPTTTQPITNYIPVLQTAAAGVARFDHNPTTGESLGLLIEEQRANLLTYSEQFDVPSGSGGWQKINCSIVANTVVAPNGTLTGDKLVMGNGIDPSSANDSGLYKIGSLTSGTYTYSIYAKAGEFSSIRFREGAEAGSFLTINLLTGAIINGSTAQFISPFAISVGNGWWRVGFTSKSNMSTIQRYLIRAASTGDGYSGIYIWGAQLEAGAFPTSYIKTEGSTVTRNADAASMTGANFSSWFSNAEGTLYTEINPRALAVSSGVQVNDNSTSNRIRLATTSTSDQGTVTTSGSAQATLDGGTPAANTNMKLAMSYRVNDFALSLNGGAAATDTSGTVPVVNQLQIGAETTTVGNLHIKKVAYYPIAISDAQKQALTTA